MKTIQCQWHDQPGWRTTVLHGPSSVNRNTTHKPLLLSFELRRKQSHLRLPIACSGITMNQLEERLDQSCPATHHPSSPQRCKSTLYAKTSQQTA